MSRWNDTIKALWREASVARRALLVGVPIVVIALAAVGIGFAMSGGGGTKNSNQNAVAPTSSATRATSPTATAVPLPTETPVSAGLQKNTAPPPGTNSSSSSRPAAPRAGSGPGAPTGTGMSLVIPAIGVNAPVYGRTVGTNGQMGNPSGPWDVVWYDFSQNYPGLGGYPGQAGANAVFAGHVDYCCPSPMEAVFWSLRDLGPGDRITVNTNSGPVNYVVDWGRWADPGADFTQYVSRTGTDSITLVTCIGTFSGGEYSNRYIVRGHRI